MKVRTMKIDGAGGWARARRLSSWRSLVWGLDAAARDANKGRQQGTPTRDAKKGTARESRGLSCKGLNKEGLARKTADCAWIVPKKGEGLLPAQGRQEGLSGRPEPLHPAPAGRSRLPGVFAPGAGGPRALRFSGA